MIDYSAQNIFGSINTVFDVTKYGRPATINIDYAIIDGKTTFITAGDYTVTMTNAEIVSRANYRAQEQFGRLQCRMMT